MIRDGETILHGVDNAKRRLAPLDALRGIAALLVLISHSYYALPEALSYRFHLPETPLRLLVLGRPAVIVFFVLSGLVLTLSLAGSYRQSYRHFVLRRVFRIWVPFAVVIIISASIHMAITPQPIGGQRAWFNWSYNQELSASLVAYHLSMVGRAQDVVLNNPIWSLIIEMRVSLLFPLMFAAFHRRPGLLAAVCVASLLVSELAVQATGLREPYFNETVTGALLITLYFVPYFLIGMLIALSLDDLRRIRGELSGLHVLGLLTVGILGLSIMHDVVNAVGSALVIMTVLVSPVAIRVLSFSAFQWLGRISYSLYLTHLVVIYVMVHLFHEVIPVSLLVAAAFPLCFLIAEITYRLVERPAMIAGRRLTVQNAVDEGSPVQ